MNVRSRFAPSPTGYLHIGSVRTALYAWLYARRHGGTFILRIEDTDRQRSTQAAVDAVLEGLAWVGIDADEGPFYQTQRFARYAEVVEQMLAAGHAYKCYCTREELDAMRAAAQAEGRKPRYDGRCRERTQPVAGVKPAIRFKNPTSGEVVVDDRVKGRIVFDNAELDDLVIARSDGTPTYNFVVVVDDMDMRITHVIRGDDHVNNTPRQINLFRALGAEPPVYAHLPMINGADGAKLSKRHGAVNVLEYREMGFLPVGLLNYLLRLGWSHGDQEIFSLQEMTSYFDLDKVSRSAANFDPAKLLWVNQQHMQTVPEGELAELLAQRLKQQGLNPENGPPLSLAVAALRARSQTVNEMAEQARCYYEEFAEFDAKSAQAYLRVASRPSLIAVRQALESLPVWSGEAAEAAVKGAAAQLELKLGVVAQPLRVALTGRAASPGIGQTLELVGRARARSRIDCALRYIETHDKEQG